VSLFRFAWRNVWRNRRRTLVTVSAMAFALLVMILWSGLVAGYLRDMERSVLDLEVGDVQITAGDYRDDPSIYTRIEDADGLLARLDEFGVPAAGRVLAYGLAAADETAAGVSFRGVDIERDARVSGVHREVVDGSWLDATDPKGVVIGRRLARILAVAPGDELVVLTQGADGSTAYDLFRVRGVLRGIADGTDRGGVFVLEQTLRELLEVPSGVHQVVVRRPDTIELADLEAHVREAAAGHDVRTWRQLMPTLSSMLDSARSLMMIWYFIIYIVVGILILNAMLMAVFERIREFGVLKALGVGPQQVFRMVLLESAIQVAIAVAVGSAIAWPLLRYLEETGIDLGTLAGTSIMGIAMDPMWRAAWSARTFVEPIGVLLVIVGVAVLYPALKAAVIAPVEAMRHQ